MTNNVGSQNFSLSETEMSYASHDIDFGRFSHTILNMVPKSEAELNESDEKRKNTSPNLNEEAAGKPDEFTTSEIVIKEIKSRLKEIITSMARDSTLQEDDLTKLIVYILSKTVPETELAMAKALSNKMSDIVSKIVSDRSDQMSSSSDIAKQAMVAVFSKIVSNERSQSSMQVKKRSVTKDQLDGLPCQVSKDVIMAASCVGLFACLAWIVAYLLIGYDAKESSVAGVIHLQNVTRRLAAATAV